jgi:hypothetical protein
VAEIRTLVEDIYILLRDNQGALSTEQLAKFGANCARHLSSELTPRDAKQRDEYTVYPSELGSTCPRKVAFQILCPEDGLPLEPWVKYKFLYGDLVEESALALARAAGHEVKLEQEPVKFGFDAWTVSGRIDAVIDGVLIDVKSCSEYAFKDYTANGITDANDKFGYQSQLKTYQMGLLYAGHGIDEAGWLLVNKTNGMFALRGLDTYDEDDWRMDNAQFLNAVDKEKKWIVDGRDPAWRPPLPHEREGASGNMKLSTVCSYCAFKKLCWPHVRMFLYSKGPVFLTTVAVEPKVPESRI